MSTPQTLAIELRNIGTYLGGNWLHEDLNLTINYGEVVAIVGGSGTGKTTLLREILMLHKPNKGEIFLLGKNTAEVGDKGLLKLRQRCGMMFQHGALFSALTVLENVEFPLLKFTDLDKDLIREIALLKISLVGLNSSALHKYPSELSGGMIKRAAVARGIALEPDILFLDEPTAGLDPRGAQALDELITQLRDTLGLTIVMVTHDLDTLWNAVDRVAFLGDKKVQIAAHMRDIMASDLPLVKQFFSGPRARAAQETGG